MATIKNFTDIPQSKVLADILPHETADMLHCLSFDGDLLAIVPKQYAGSFRHQPELTIPCWSLSALLDVIPGGEIRRTAENKWEAVSWNDFKVVIKKDDNPIDACYKLILRLHELNLL